MTIKQFIEKAIEGGYYASNRFYKTAGVMPEDAKAEDIINYFDGHTEPFFLDPTAWRAVGKVEGWGDSKYRACEMKMPFYHKELMRGTGAIVGESKDGKQWYVRWDFTRYGKPTKNGGVRSPYPKENIVEKSAEKNWLMVWHRMIDALADGRSLEDYLSSL